MYTILFMTLNIRNNKSLLGIHETENPYKFDGYLGEGIDRKNYKTIFNPKTPFQLDVKKYGFDAFLRVTIKVFNSKSDAQKFLNDILTDENISRKDVYNVDLEHSIHHYNGNGQYLKSYTNFKDAAKVNNCRGRSILISLQDRIYYNGYWTWIKYDQYPYIKSITRRGVDVFNELGELVESFDTVNQCRKKYPNCIRVLKGLANKCKGYTFKYKVKDIV